ncbi:MAG: tetratricopeptide repeat protein, partial [Terracidiphilus sp.]
MDSTTGATGKRGWLGSIRRGFRLRSSPFAWAVVLFLLIPIEDVRPGRIEAAYDHALKLFQLGRLPDSQREAEQGYEEFRVSSPEWAAKFQLLEADAMVWRGVYDDALRLLAGYPEDNVSGNSEGIVRKLTIESVILTHQRQFLAANQSLSRAVDLCKARTCASCGDVLRARGSLAINQGQPALARRYYLDAVTFAHAHHDRFLEASVSLNLGVAAIRADRFDEALDWSSAAYRAAVELGADNLAQGAAGNIGWAYYQLGDDERALELFLEAEKSAARLGNLRSELNWTVTAGYVYRDTGDLVHAAQSYSQALNLAKRIDSKED